MAQTDMNRLSSPADTDRKAAGRARHRLPPDVATHAAWIALVGVAGLLVAWLRTSHLAESAAFFGFEPSGLLDPVWQRPAFTADFPNGEAEMLKSLVGQAYRMLGYLPLSERTLVGGMILAEFACLAAGAYVCARFADRRLPAWTALGAALFLTTGTIVNCDLARWFHPYYGSAYNFAYGAGLAGFAAILAGRPVAAGLALGVTAAIHPIIALFFGLAMAAAVAVRLPRYRIGSLAAGAGLALLIGGGWAYVMLARSGVTGGEVDPALYVGLTRLMSVHWYPISIGVFTTRSWETFLPFTGMMVLFASVAGGPGSLSNPAHRQFAAALAVLLVVTAAGVFLSEYSGIPLLVKLALHRASAVALILAAIIIVPALLQSAVSASPPRAALSALLLVMPFWRGNGLPILLCMLYALLVAFEERGRRSRAGLALPLLAAGLAAVIVGLLHAFGSMAAIFSEHTHGLGNFGKPLFAVAFALALLARLLRQPALLAIPLLLGVAAWSPALTKFRNEDTLAQARAYLEVQDWARENTAPDALFMVDPGHAYGWREHSERPSFGTLREWLYSGWIYNTQAEVMAEGMRRTASLGIDLEAFLARPGLSVSNGYAELRSEASRRFHSAPPEWFAEMAATYGIDYFVLDKTKTQALPDLPRAFENERYAVLQPAG
jgi:hypothetical protein